MKHYCLYQHMCNTTHVTRCRICPGGGRDHCHLCEKKTACGRDLEELEK